MLKFRRLAYALGAEVAGLDLRRPLDEETVAELRSLLLEHAVLCFHDQPLVPEELDAFGARFGVANTNQTSRGLPGSSNVRLVSNKPETVGGKLIAGLLADKWHSDISTDVRPATITFLNMKTLPEIGGNTMFANARMAYEHLSAGMQGLLEPLEGIHDCTLESDFHRLPPEIQAERMQLRPAVAHPIVRVHPETGRKALYVSEYVRNFAGMSLEESQPLLRFLMEHQTRYEFVYRHVWAQDDLIMWDNRSVVHLGVSDYDLSQSRRMLRVSLVGDKLGHLYESAVASQLPAAASTRPMNASPNLV